MCMHKFNSNKDQNGKFNTTALSMKILCMLTTDGNKYLYLKYLQVSSKIFLCHQLAFIS